MKDKEDRNGARRYMAEELYVGNSGYPYTQIFRMDAKDKQ